VSAIRTIELIETRLGQPRVIGQDRHGADIWSSIDRQRTYAPYLYLTWTGLANDRPTETRLKNAKELKKGSGVPGLIHGGPDKAVYVFPIEHYPRWTARLGARMGGRSLGENWRLRGVTEGDVRIGDVWVLGDAELEVSKPREPCLTLQTYYGGEKMIKIMAQNGWCGWYLSVRRPGMVPTTGTIEVVSRGSGPTVAEAFAAKMRPSAG
jgi:MOSC domain-containing protein YiiM